MRQSAALIIIILAAWAIAIVISRRRLSTRSPRRQRRSARRSAWVMVAFFAFMVAQDLMRNRVSFWTFWVGGCGLMMLLWQLLGAPEQFSDAEATANYAADGQHCGRCEYDLTGNQSGVCPECGWQIPRDVRPEDREYVYWAAWWIRWRILHLDNWRKTLALTVLLAAALAGTAIGMSLLIAPGAGIPAAAICLVVLVNVARVVAYARRCGQL